MIFVMLVNYKDRERGLVMVHIMTVKEAAEKWGITPRRITEMIREGRIKGVYKIGLSWVMPAKTQKPVDMRTQRKKSKVKTSDKSKYCAGN
jgi:excisionase family DNA binding protein